MHGPGDGDRRKTELPLTLDDAPGHLNETEQLLELHPIPGTLVPEVCGLAQGPPLTSDSSSDSSTRALLAQSLPLCRLEKAPIPGDTEIPAQWTLGPSCLPAPLPPL